MKRPSSSSFSEHWPAVGLWVLLAVALAFVRPLAMPDEGRYGDVGRWMLVSGDWLTPRLDGLPFFHKPPLLYWLDAAAMAVFGVHPWVARLVPVLHGALMLLGTLWFAHTRIDRQTAQRVRWILGSCMLLLGGADYVNCDIEVACWISLAIWFFAAALLQPERATWPALAGFAACALGVLSKGLIGVVLPGMVMFLWVALDNRWKLLGCIPWIRGWSLFAAMALPWFILLEQRYGGFFHYFFIEQQFTRYVGTEFNNRQPLLFYVVCLLVFCFPFVAVLRPRWTGNSTASYRSVWRLCWATVLAILVFFSIPASKLVGYILPVVPALMLLTAMAWPHAVTTMSSRWAMGLGSLMLGCVFAILSLLGPIEQHWPLWLGVASGVLGALWWSGLWANIYRLNANSLLRLAALQSITTLILVNVGVAVQTEVKSAAPLAHYLLQHDTHPRLIYWGTYPFDLPFYLNSQEPSPILSSWHAREQFSKDDGDQQLIDGIAFEPATAGVLHEFNSLPVLHNQQPQAWLVSGRLPQDPRILCCFEHPIPFGNLTLWQPRQARN